MSLTAREIIIEMASQTCQCSQPVVRGLLYLFANANLALYTHTKLTADTTSQLASFLYD